MTVTPFEASGKSDALPQSAAAKRYPVVLLKAAGVLAVLGAVVALVVVAAEHGLLM